jgi:hypothetical protein
MKAIFKGSRKAFMYEQIVAAIREGSDREIVALFELRANAAQLVKQLEALRPSPALRTERPFDRDSIRRSCADILQTIDNYLRGSLSAVCRIGNDVIYTYAGLCVFRERWGAAYGDLDITEDGLTFINPALPGITLWGVFDDYQTIGILPPVSLRHFAPGHAISLNNFMQSALSRLLANRSHLPTES